MLGDHLLHEMLGTQELGTTLRAEPTPRLMKNSSIRRPDVIPFGLTCLDARVRAMVRASFAKRPRGGVVETVVTVWTQRRLSLLRLFGLAA